MWIHKKDIMLDEDDMEDFEYISHYINSRARFNKTYNFYLDEKFMAKSQDKAFNKLKHQNVKNFLIETFRVLIYSHTRNLPRSYIINFLLKIIPEINDKKFMFVLCFLFNDYIRSLDGKIDSKYIELANDIRENQMYGKILEKLNEILIASSKLYNKNKHPIPDESIDEIFKSIFGEQKGKSSSEAASSSDINTMNLLLTQNQIQSNRRIRNLANQLKPREAQDYLSQRDVYKFNERNDKFN